MRKIPWVCLVVLVACDRPVAHEFVPEPVGQVVVASRPPLKVILMISATQTINVTDALGQRASALTALLEVLPADASLMVVLFAGSTLAFLSQSGLIEFERIDRLFPAQRYALLNRILNFVPPGGLTPIADFVRPLESARTIIEADPERDTSRYEIIFVADGSPGTDQDAELLCQGLVTTLVSPSIADVRLNAAFLNQEAVTPCSDPIVESGCSVQPASSGCAASIIAANEMRLQRMTELGHGTFRSFRAGETVDYCVLLH